MKQQTKKKLTLFIDAIVALILMFFFIFGAITTISKVSAEVNNVMPDTEDKSNWLEFELKDGDVFGGNYYRFEYTEKSIGLFNISALCTGFSGVDEADFVSWDPNNGVHIALTPFKYEIVNYNGVEYVEVYFPEEMNYKPNGENGDYSDIFWTPETTISYPNSNVKRIENIRSITYQSIIPEFEIPEKTDRSDWIESDVVKGETFGGKYYRISKTACEENSALITIKMYKNEVYSNVKWYLAEKLTFLRYGVEVQTQVYDGEIYYEFYLPETFDITCVMSYDTTNILHDSYDATCTVVSVDNKGLKVITAPEEVVPNEPSDEPSDEPTDEIEEKTGCGSFFTDVGTVVNEVLKIEDVEPFASGITTVVLGVVILGICLILAIKK